MARVSKIDVAPSAARLTSSLRDIGYDFQTAIADLVDNSISAEARRIHVETVFVPDASYVLICDDGRGMTEKTLIEALRFGSRREYSRNELGRFGLGLKTGSFSQCRRLTVVTRHSLKQNRVLVRTLDLNRIERTDQWVFTEDESSPAIDRARKLLEEGPGTVIVWEDLDRVVPERHASTSWGKRRLAAEGKKTAEHLGVVFHRFIHSSDGAPEVVISVNGDKVQGWDPFGRSEPATEALSPEIYAVQTGNLSAPVRFQGFVLPARDKFSSHDEFERMSGPLKWNRQQGLYIYRANRLVHFGGWQGIRGIDEHTKLARAAVDFDTDLDESFQINVAKMRVALPPSLKQMLERPVNELCMRADDAYRKAATHGSRTQQKSSGSDNVALRDEIGVLLKGAMLDQAPSLAVFRDALDQLRKRHPDLARGLGL